MPGGWSMPREIARLADSRAEYEFGIPVSELPGLPVESSSDLAPLQVRLRFGREQGLPVATVAISGEVWLQCQRCLQPVRQLVASETQVALVEDEEQGARVPEHLESYLAAEGRVSFDALAAEELLLALPHVPRHADEAACALAGAGAVAGGGTMPVGPEEAAAGETQRPFADLRALLERGKS
jgi:uncharacterized protein